jgi:hypothetical protein
MNRTQLLETIRNNLCEPTASIWTNDYLQDTINQVVAEVSRREPLYKTAWLPITEYTCDVDISSLTSLVDVIKVEYPASNHGYQPAYRYYTRTDKTITIDLDTIPTLTKGTLTGTITFTKGSRTVTGSGSLFTTQLYSNFDDGNGYLIGVSSGSKFYQVAHIDSDTSLTLASVFEEATVTDTVSVTKYRDHESCAKIHYGKEYTYDSTTPVFYGSGLDDITIGGYFSGTALTEYRVKITTASTTDKYRWSNDSGSTWSAEVNCSATAANIENALTVAFGATTGHSLDEYWKFYAQPTDVPHKLEEVIVLGVVAHAAMEFASDKAVTKMTDIETDLTSLRTVINAVNIGGDEATKYNQTIGSEINVAMLIKSYREWAQLKWNEYQYALRHNIGRMEDTMSLNCSRSI